MDNGSVVVSKCENALNGTALLKAELVVPAEPAPELVLVLVVVVESTLAGGVSAFDEGVKSGLPVSALEPADVEPTDEEEDAGAPLAPFEAPLWI